MPEQLPAVIQPQEVEMSSQKIAQVCSRLGLAPANTSVGLFFVPVMCQLNRVCNTEMKREKKKPNLLIKCSHLEGGEWLNVAVLQASVGE